jgi:L-ribulokinase
MKYAVGVDFGTESGRAVLVDVASRDEIATAVHAYANGVIDECLPPPDDHVRIGADWALQDPADHIDTFRHAVPETLRLASASPGDVIGLGIDFTSCTMLPTTSAGVPRVLHDYFGRGTNDVMRRLRAIQEEVVGGSEELAREVVESTVV